MTVLLTGGAGYIGSHVAVELLQSGYDVIIADNFYNSSQEVPKRIRKITEKSVRTYNVDIQNSAALEQIFKQDYRLRHLSTQYHPSVAHLHQKK